MRRFLPFEQVVRAVGQVQQLDAFLNVGLVGGLVRRELRSGARTVAYESETSGSSGEYNGALAPSFC